MGLAAAKVMSQAKIFPDESICGRTSPLGPGREVGRRRHWRRRFDGWERRRRRKSLVFLFSWMPLVNCPPGRWCWTRGEVVILRGWRWRSSYGWRCSGLRLQRYMRSLCFIRESRPTSACNQGGAYSPPALYLAFTAMSSEISLQTGPQMSTDLDWL